MTGFYSTVLTQPFPTYRQHKKQMLVCIIAAITVFLMLYLLEPFNINLLNKKQKFTYAITYSSITLITCISLTVVGPWLFPNFFKESNWTVLKEVCYIFFILIVISALNLIAHNIYDNIPINLKEFFISLTYTLPLAAFPVSFSILIKQKWLKDKYRQEAKIWNNMLQNFQKGVLNSESLLPVAPDAEVNSDEEIIIQTESDVITITGTGIGEIIEIEVNNLLFISSADNYITVHYLAEQNVKNTILRNTLKSTEDKIKHIGTIIRCHRSYIVNLNKVERIIGDAQGLKLLIKGINDPILVGKSYLSTVKEMLQNIKPIN